MSTAGAAPPQYRRNPLRTEEKVRELTAGQLGLVPPSVAARAAAPPPPPPEPLPLEIDEQDERLQEVLALLEDGYAGVILTGPPGTSKSWYAEQIAAYLADRDPERVRFLQFHSSYQYEDFVEGFVPKENGFDLLPKHLLEMCTVAREYPAGRCVLVIDELSRSDPARVFGEALTYIEMSYRDRVFRLASLHETSIPPNLVILATMNPLDRGVDDVDAALERRFAKIAMDPDAALLERILIDNGVDEALRARILQFFTFLQRNPNPYAKVGHAYFRMVRDESSLRRLWKHQLRFHQEKAYHLIGDGFNQVEREWNRLFEAPSPPRQAPGVELAPSDQEPTDETPDDGDQTEGQEP